MNEELDEGTQYIINHSLTNKGKDVCHYCGIKLGLLNSKKVYYRFGLTRMLCKNCYKEYIKPNL